MTTVIFAILILTSLGLILGIGLGVAEKKLSTEKDAKLEALEQAMPGANCGGCGFAGCSAYAKAVFEGSAKPGLCSPGGQQLATTMGNIMGVSVEKVEKQVAHVFCSGNALTTKKDFEYKGIADCNAASILFKGDLSCKSGCLHMLSCQKVCESDAIYVDSENNVKVDPSKCTGCGKCAKVCPNQVIRLMPVSEEYAVDCNNHDSGATVRKICETGCIGCKICEVKFPNSLFEVKDFLSSKKAGETNEDTVNAALACPRKVIRKTNNR